MKVLKSVILCLLLICAMCVHVYAEESPVYEDTKYGISGVFGYTYDPADQTYFTQASFCALFDYDRIWHHRAPEALRFKTEVSAGASFLENGDVRFITNANIFALYYIGSQSHEKIKPYVEAGIGLIYTDYRVDEQAYRLNFNPQAGVGLEYTRKSGHTNFMAFRLHHLSNGGLSNNNRGQNSIVLMFGQYF